MMLSNPEEPGSFAELDCHAYQEPLLDVLEAREGSSEVVFLGS